MELMPKEIAETIPPLYTTEDEPGALLRVKLFTPDSDWTWYVIEYDPADRMAFGLVVGHETELGSFSIAELESVTGPGGMPVERDLYWTPRPLSYIAGDRE